MEWSIGKYILILFLFSILVIFQIWLKKIWDKHRSELDFFEILFGSLLALIVGNGLGLIELVKSPNTRFGIGIFGSIFIIALIVVVAIYL